MRLLPPWPSTAPAAALARVTAGGWVATEAEIVCWNPADVLEIVVGRPDYPSPVAAMVDLTEPNFVAALLVCPTSGIPSLAPIFERKRDSTTACYLAKAPLYRSGSLKSGTRHHVSGDHTGAATTRRRDGSRDSASSHSARLSPPRSFYSDYNRW
jgi:hypothetical protein